MTRLVALVVGVAALALAATALADVGDLTPAGCVERTGSLDDCVEGADGLDGAFAVAVSPDSKSVYVASRTDDAVVRFHRNPTTGALVPKGCIDDNDSGADDCTLSTDGLDGASSIAVSADGKSVYAGSDVDDAVVRFQRDLATGAIVPKGCIDDNDTGADSCARSADGLNEVRDVAVSSDGKSVYAAGVADDAVTRFNRDTNGAIVARNCIEDNDAGADDCAPTADGLNGPVTLAVSADGESVYAGSLDDHAVVRFDRDTTTGAIVFKNCTDDNDSGTDACTGTTDGLRTVRSVDVSDDGTSVYALSGADNAIVRFNRKETGGLVPKGCLDDEDTGGDVCAQTVPGLGTPLSLDVSADGESVYAVSLGDSAIVNVHRDPATGAITPVGCINDPDNTFETCPVEAEGLSGASGVAATPNGAAVFVVSQVDRAVVRFTRETP